MFHETLTGLAEHRTPHYVFHYHPDTPAARDIRLIAAEQERCFARITEALQVMPDFPLHYLLLETPEQVGALYEQATGVSIGPINGCAHLPDTVTAVYNEEVQCTGIHEDTHLIAQLVGDPWQGFLIEGLAMYMDETWWGERNEKWVQQFLTDGRYVPLAQTLSLPVYLQKVYAAGCDAEQCLPTLLGKPLQDIETDFLQWVRSIQF